MEGEVKQNGRTLSNFNAAELHIHKLSNIGVGERGVIQSASYNLGTSYRP